MLVLHRSFLHFIPGGSGFAYATKKPRPDFGGAWVSSVWLF
jgi:hypothetical protein